ncbi:hypothetical protein [Streptomyces osmaniensis]|uniref:Secreted protein n=1 Tax=Streptomyces osmaniensis TaxID=593134 RepID=A0ABP6W3A6_9ACTN
MLEIGMNAGGHMAIDRGLALSPRRPVTGRRALLLCIVMMLVALLGCSSGDGSGGSGDGTRSTRDGAHGEASSGGGGPSGEGDEDGTTGGDSAGSPGEEGRTWQPGGGSSSGQGGRDWTGDEDGGNDDESSGSSDRDKRDDESSGSSDRDKREDIAWLPWGPKSPTTQATHDARHTYDLLQAGKCQEAMDLVRSWGSDQLSWTVIEGLAGACLAAQGRQDGWHTAVTADEKLSRAGYRPDPGWCKEGDAYATLKRLTAFHRAHSRGKVRLVGNAPGVMACDSGITGVSFALDGTAVRPEEHVTVEGTWPGRPTAIVLSWGDGQSKRIDDDWPEGSTCCERALLWFTFPDDLAGRPSSVRLEVVGEGFSLGYQSPLDVSWPSPAP